MPPTPNAADTYACAISRTNPRGGSQHNPLATQPPDYREADTNPPHPPYTHRGGTGTGATTDAIPLEGIPEPPRRPASARVVGSRMAIYASHTIHVRAQDALTTDVYRQLEAGRMGGGGERRGRLPRQRQLRPRGGGRRTVGAIAGLVVMAVIVVGVVVAAVVPEGGAVMYILK